MPIRLLVVDDSAVIRHLLSRQLDMEPDFEVVATARDGQHAIERVAEVRPDVVIMDLEMPVMDGVDAVGHLRVLHARLPIIMFSSHTEVGARATMDALLAGATTYASKNPGPEGMPHLISQVLAPKIRAVCSGAPRGVRSHRPPSQVPSIHRRAGARVTASVDRVPVRCLAIGCSTGGPAALAEVIPSLPADLEVPVLVVQHMPPRFTQLLAERLDKASALAVVEAENGEEVLPGKVYIAPGGYHMALRVLGPRVVIALDQGEPVNSCRPAVDRLFDSVAQAYGGATLAVVMTGMGQDGMKGAARLVETGATVITQDEESCVVWGMPRSVVRAGLSDQEYPLDRLGLAIASRVRARRLGRTA